MIQHGHEALGFTVHVPHYLAQNRVSAGRRRPCWARSRESHRCRSRSTSCPRRAEVYTKISASAEVVQGSVHWNNSTIRSVAAQENRSLLARRGTTQRR